MTQHTLEMSRPTPSSPTKSACSLRSTEAPVGPSTTMLAGVRTAMPLSWRVDLPSIVTKFRPRRPQER